LHTFPTPSEERGVEESFLEEALLSRFLITRMYSYILITKKNTKTEHRLSLANLNPSLSEF
jgi:hypothetical protein